MGHTTVNIDKAFEGMTAKEILQYVKNVLEENDYNFEKQITGYLMTGDPSYIPRHNNARNVIKVMDRDEIIKELVLNTIG